MFISAYISASKEGLSGLENFKDIRPYIWNSLIFAFECKGPRAPLKFQLYFSLRGMESMYLNEMGDQA